MLHRPHLGAKSAELRGYLFDPVKIEPLFGHAAELLSDEFAQLVELDRMVGVVAKPEIRCLDAIKPPRRIQDCADQVLALLGGQRFVHRNADAGGNNANTLRLRLREVETQLLGMLRHGGLESCALSSSARGGQVDEFARLAVAHSPLAGPKSAASMWSRVGCSVVLGKKRGAAAPSDSGVLPRRACRLEQGATSPAPAAAARPGSGDVAGAERRCATEAFSDVSPRWWSDVRWNSANARPTTPVPGKRSSKSSPGDAPSRRNRNAQNASGLRPGRVPPPRAGCADRKSGNPGRRSRAGT